MGNNSELIIYTTEDGLTKVDVTFDDDTVWLSLDRMSMLFQRDKSTISRHIKNIFDEGELEQNSVVAKFATTASDGKTYQVDFYMVVQLSDIYVQLFRFCLFSRYRELRSVFPF